MGRLGKLKRQLIEEANKRLLGEQSSPSINISSNGVSGTYIGPSQNPNDNTHRFINTITTIVGDELKKLYNKGQWTIVDLDGIKLETIIDKTLGNRIDNNTGQVEFKVDIPFIQVNNACDAYTSFDRRGGWGHGEGYKLDHLKDEVGHLPTKGTSLDISDMKKTPEGLVEYFAQWKNPNYQSHCGGNKSKPITITFNDLGDARDQLLALPKDNYGNATIDGNTITISKDGDTTTGISGIFDPSEDNLNQRLTDMKNKYGYEAMSDIVKVGNYWFVVLKTE